MKVHYIAGFISYIWWTNVHIFLSQFQKTYLLFMEYPSIRGEELAEYAENSTLNILHA